MVTLWNGSNGRERARDVVVGDTTLGRGVDISPGWVHPARQQAAVVAFGGPHPEFLSKQELARKLGQIVRLPGDNQHGRFSRRNLLFGAGVLASTAFAADAAPDLAGASTLFWPTKHLGSKAATTVDASQFLSVAQLRQWHEELDAMGMRSTGSPVHERFIDVLVSRLKQVGVEQVHTQPVRFERWSAYAWSLELAEPHSKGKIATSSYIPYSGSTLSDGVTGPLSLIKAGEALSPGSLAGKIALFDVPTSPVAYSTMEEISYGKYDPQDLIDPAAQYSRPWGGVSDLITLLDNLQATGAIGCIGIIDLPAAGAHGSYYPYDGRFRRVPGVFVDRPTGQYLSALSISSTPVRLTLAATTQHVVSRNVVGLIPGRSNEVVILNSHTDGPNAVEDNGPNTIIAISQYLSRLPQDALPRSVMVSFTTGHFHGGIGQVTFVKDNRDSILPKAACALTLEHLGALEWEENAENEMALTGRPELGVIFVPENKAMVDASLAALQRAGAGPALVLRPYVTAAGSPNGYGWPGEGTQLWSVGHVMTMNYITGPTYLLNWGIPTLHKCDISRMRREAIAFTQMTLDVCGTTRSSLASLDLSPL